MAKEQLDDVNFEILWEGKPAGLWDLFLDVIHMNFTSYQITKDELIITTGFFRRHSNTFELYTLKDPDLTETLIQRWLKVGTVSVTVDAHGKTERIGTKIYLKNFLFFLHRYDPFFYPHNNHIPLDLQHDTLGLIILVDVVNLHP